RDDVEPPRCLFKICFLGRKQPLWLMDLRDVCGVALADNADTILPGCVIKWVWRNLCDLPVGGVQDHCAESGAENRPGSFVPIQSRAGTKLPCVLHHWTDV